MKIKKLVEHLLSRNKEYIFPLFGCSLIHWSLGFAYTLGNIVPYVASYMSLIGKNNVSIGKLCWIECIFVLFQGGSNYLNLSVINCIGYTVILYIGVICSFLGLFFSYLFLDNFFLYLLAYSVIYATGHGILYSLTVELVTDFYGKDLSPNIMGILFLFRGFSTAVIPAVQTLIVNPKDLYCNFLYNNDKLFNNLTVIEGIPRLFRFMIIFSTITQLVGSIILTKGIKNSENKDKNIKKTIKSELSSTFSVANSESFRIMWLISFLTWPCIQYIQVYWKIHGLFNTKLGDKQLSRISSVTLVSHTFFRIFWGIFEEIAGHLNCICTLTSILVLGLSLLMFPLFESLYVIQYIIGYILISIAHSGTSVVFPSMLIRNFGSSKLFVTFLLLFTAKASSCFLFCILTDITTKYLNIQYSLIPLLIFSIGSFFLSFILKDLKFSHIITEQAV